MAKATDPNEQMLQNLADSGFNTEEIHQFLQAFHAENNEYQRKLLIKQKCLLRNQLHAKQKQIDNLDYLIFRLKL